MLREWTRLGKAWSPILVQNEIGAWLKKQSDLESQGSGSWDSRLDGVRMGFEQKAVR